MIVCSCNVISDHDIRSVVVSVDDDLGSAAQVYGCLGCTVRCGLCSHSVKRILAELLSDCLQYSGPSDLAPPPPSSTGAETHSSSISSSSSTRSKGLSSPPPA